MLTSYKSLFKEGIVIDDEFVINVSPSNLTSLSLNRSENNANNLESMIRLFFKSRESGVSKRHNVEGDREIQYLKEKVSHLEYKLDQLIDMVSIGFYLTKTEQKLIPCLISSQSILVSKNDFNCESDFVDINISFYPKYYKDIIFLAKLEQSTDNYLKFSFILGQEEQEYLEQILFVMHRKFISSTKK